MSNSAARNLFVFGSLFFFIVLVILTFDTMGKLDSRAPEITDQVNAGKKVWHKYDCIGCHTILGNGSYFAPDMTKVTVRKPKSYLKKFIMNPKGVKPTAAMPTLGLTDKEADNLLSFLDWMSKVDTNDWPPKPILAIASTGKDTSMGQVLFQQEDCIACHQINGIGGVSGPDLTHIGSQRPDVDWHIAHLKDPESAVPDSAMPDFSHLNETALKDLANYLITLK
jgi:nitric oxide reductase subunit C